MGKQAFTPWTVEVSQNLSHAARVVCNSDGEFGDDICLVGDVTKGNNTADARLIAAAPELYAHLEFAVKLLGGLPGFAGTAQIESMRAALAKAVTP